MITTIEISNYPLADDYLPKITDFIDRCIASGIKVKVNTTSTLLQGDYDHLMGILQQEMKTSFELYGQMIFVIKVLKGELDLNYQH